MTLRLEQRDLDHLVFRVRAKPEGPWLSMPPSFDPETAAGLRAVPLGIAVLATVGHLHPPVLVLVGVAGLVLAWVTGARPRRLVAALFTQAQDDLRRAIRAVAWRPIEVVVHGHQVLVRGREARVQVFGDQMQWDGRFFQLERRLTDAEEELLTSALQAARASARARAGLGPPESLRALTRGAVD